MKREGQLVFLCAAVAALTLYALTAPGGLPWNASTRLALAYLGEVVRFPVMPHPIWGFHVQVFYGPTALSVVCAALAAGLLAALVNRYFCWRFAVAASLVWIFLPGVWNRAITGERSICLAAMVVVAVWVLNAVALRVLKKARAARRSAPATVGGDVLGVPTAHEEAKKRSKANRIVGRTALGAAGVFALVSLTLHDYRYGEAASVFARGVVEAAGERVIVMNGVVDIQIVDAASRATLATSLREATCGRWMCVRKEGDLSSQTRQDAASTIALRNDDAYRTNLVAWVRSAFPADTNLWVAAQVGPQAFVGVATKKFPDRFYLMNGKSTTLEEWERRWEDFRPYLDSSDPFVPVARRMFGYEGNAVANALVDVASRTTLATSLREATCGRWICVGKEGDSFDQTRQDAASTGDAASTAYALYKRIYNEVDPGNFSALVNMSEMIRRGHAVSGDEKKNVQERLESFFKDANNRKHMREIARTAGPVRVDHEMLEKMAAEAKKRIAAKIAAGEEIEHSPEILSLLEWSREMFALMDKGETAKAGRIARAILSNPKWRDYLPANAVMGAVSASEGDYVASETFFRTAVSTTNKVATVVLNDYADTLMHLRKLDEAEQMARRAVAASDERYWIARLTLAQVLVEKVKVDAASRTTLSTSLREATCGRWICVGKEGDPSSQTRQDAASTGGAASTKEEISSLLKSVLKHAPEEMRERVRKEHKEYVR